MALFDKHKSELKEFGAHLCFLFCWTVSCLRDSVPIAAPQPDFPMNYRSGPGKRDWASTFEHMHDVEEQNKYT